MKSYFANLPWGVLIALATLLIPYQYCMDGAGRGLPFAVYSPSCGAWWVVYLFDDRKIPQILDLAAFAADVLIWATAVVLARSLIRRRSYDPS